LVQAQTPHHTEVTEYLSDVRNLCTIVEAVELSRPLFSHAASYNEGLRKLSKRGVHAPRVESGNLQALDSFLIFREDLRRLSGTL
jgi:hypothetical protein